MGPSKWTDLDETNIPYNPYLPFEEPTPGQIADLQSEVNQARYESIEWLYEHFDVDSYLQTRSSIQHLINYFKGEKRK